jgi:uncharacterized ferredoxin-like protein
MDELKKAVLTVASLMALSARTAPKARGQDEIWVTVISGEKLDALGREMERYGSEGGPEFFVRDGRNVMAAVACVIIGVRGASPAGLNCGACGYPTCAEMAVAHPTVKQTFSGPNCAVRMTDIGIAVGSAAKTASIHNLDNRVMYSAGVTALRLGWMPECTVAFGIPLAASGKNIFFDR